MAEEYEDDLTILNQENLWRRIHPNWKIRDENTGAWRPSSAAFSDSRDGSPMSVYLADVVAQTKRTAEDIIRPFEGYALASLTAGDVRSCKQGVYRSPTHEELAHASVFGPKPKPIQRELARRARWVIFPG